MKPSDLMLSVIEFFGILIPGAILVFLHGDFILSPLGLSLGFLQEAKDWIIAFFISIILGHLLHSLSDQLDELAARFLSVKTKSYQQEACKHLQLPSGVPPIPKNYFYSAFSFARIHSSDAVVELDRHAADYKLFRSLTLVFLLDIPLSALSCLLSWERAAASTVLFCFSAYRFRQLLDWTYALAFDFYLQIQKAPSNGKS